MDACNRGGTGGRGGADLGEPNNVLYITNFTFSASEEIVKTTLADASFHPKAFTIFNNL
jgi:hypothetical protein